MVDLTGDHDHGRLDGSLESKYGELHVDGKVVVYTDGAARGNQYKNGKYAGVGAFWGISTPLT